jgi:hypothetical protein
LQADGEVVSGIGTIFEAVPGAVQVILPRKTRKRLKKNRKRRNGSATDRLIRPPRPS